MFTTFGLTLTWVSILNYNRRLGRPHGIAYVCTVGGLILTSLHMLLLALDESVVWLAVLAAAPMALALLGGVVLWDRRFRFAAEQATPRVIGHD